MAKSTFANKLRNFFGIHKAIDDAFFEELSDLLVEGDLGAKYVYQLMEDLEKKCKSQHISNEKEIIDELKKILQ